MQTLVIFRQHKKIPSVVETLKIQEKTRLSIKVYHLFNIVAHGNIILKEITQGSVTTISFQNFETHNLWWNDGSLSCTIPCTHSHRVHCTPNKPTNNHWLVGAHLTGWHGDCIHTAGAWRHVNCHLPLPLGDTQHVCKNRGHLWPQQGRGRSK